MRWEIISRKVTTCRLTNQQSHHGLMAELFQAPTRDPVHDAASESHIATGRLTGGNLTVIHALMGTPYEIETRDRVLFLEDVGESTLSDRSNALHAPPGR